MKKIVLVGAGGHAKTVVDTIERSNEYEIAGFIDSDEIGKEIYRGYRIIGHDADRDRIYEAGIREAVLAVGFMGRSELRNALSLQYKESGFVFPAIIDPTAVVAQDAVIGEGTYVGRNAVINADAGIGNYCIINTAVVIEHECQIGDFSHIAVSAVLCGQVRVGENVFIGANATVIQGIVICDKTIVGAGSVVTKDLRQHCTAAGVPAKILSQNER